jgi:hypothetical protein
MSRNSGIIYLIHFERPVGQPDPHREARGRAPRKGAVRGAQHYLGWAKDWKARVGLHRVGAGSKLCKAAVDAEIRLIVVRRWENESRSKERQIKRTHHLSSYCPKCREKVNAKRRKKYAKKKAQQ